MTRIKELSAKEWNQRHHIGTLVRYYPILPTRTDFTPIETATRSDAWDLQTGRPVIFLTGVDGWVSLFNLEVIEPIIDVDTQPSTSHDAAKLLFQRVLKTICERKYDLASSHLVEAGLPEAEADNLILIVVGLYGMMSSPHASKLKLRGMQLLVKLAESLVPYCEAHGDAAGSNER